MKKRTVSRDQLGEMTRSGMKITSKKKSSPEIIAPEKPKDDPVVGVVAEALGVVAQNALLAQAQTQEMVKNIAKVLKEPGSRITSMKINRKEHKQTGIPLIEDIDFYYEELS
jgi:hypothetical protein